MKSDGIAFSDYSFAPAARSLFATSTWPPAFATESAVSPLDVD